MGGHAAMALVSHALEQSSTFKKRLAMGLVALGIVILVLDSYARRRARAISTKTCLNTETRDATIVLVMATRRAVEPAAALFDAFENANCPHRVSALVYEARKAGERSSRPSRPSQSSDATSAVSMNYIQRVKQFSRTGVSHADRIRVMLGVPVGSRLAAVHQVLQAHYRGEAFVVVMDDDVHLVKGWDTAVLNARLATRNTHAVIVAPPIRGAPLSAFPHGTYTHMSGFSRAGIPLAAAAALQRPAAVPCVMAHTSLMMAPAPFFTTALDWHDYAANLGPGEEDALVTAEAGAKGWDLFTAAAPLATQPASTPVERDWCLDAAACARDASVLTKVLKGGTLAAALRAKGLLPTPTAAARLGVVTDSDLVEVVAKHGSLSQYAIAKGDA